MDDMLLKLIEDKHQHVMQGIQGVHDRLDELNGRTRTNEKHIAVIHDRQKLLWGGLGTVGAGLIAWVVERFAR